MKRNGDDDEFNSAREMRARGGFLGMLVGFTAGIALTTAGVLGMEPGTLLAGVGLLGAGFTLRAWLRKSGNLARTDAAWHRAAQARAEAAREVGRAAELVQLLNEWQTIEGRRGSAGFDPWALQAVRHEIRVIVEEDPALEELFHDHRRAA